MRRLLLEDVSVLFNEPKLLKLRSVTLLLLGIIRFSALQRAEIAEIGEQQRGYREQNCGFSALQRAEIAEISRPSCT